MKKKEWFSSFGILHYPISFQGWTLTIVAAAFMLNVFVAIDRNSHSVIDTLYGIFPYWAPTLIILELTAQRTSKK